MLLGYVTVFELLVCKHSITHNVPVPKYVRTESDTARGRLCRSLRFFNRLGGKKTKQQTQNVITAGVQDHSTEVETSNYKYEDTGHNTDLLIQGRILRIDEEEDKNQPGENQQNVGFIVADNVWEPVGKCPSEIIQPLVEISDDSVKSASAVIVVDDSKCDTRVTFNDFETELETKDSCLNTSHGDNVSVESRHISRSKSGSINELKPSGSTAAKDIAEVLDAHIARERRMSTALSTHAAKVTEWKREVSLFESTESVLGLVSSPLATSRYYAEIDVPVPSSCHGIARYSSNIRLSDTVLPEDDEEVQGLETDELVDEDAEVQLDLNDTRSGAPLSSTASLTFREESSRDSRWEANLVDAATSAHSTTVVHKEDVSTGITPVTSHLRAADISHIDESGISSKRPHGMRVKWGGRWKSSTTEADSTSKPTPSVGSSISFTSPSGACSSPGLSLGTLDSLSTLTLSEELECPSPRTTCAHADTQAVHKLAELLEELSADEQPWVRFLKYFFPFSRTRFWRD